MNVPKILLVAVLALSAAEAFFIAKVPATRTHMETLTSLKIFGDAFKGAFSNDPALGKPQNSGLTNVRKRINRLPYNSVTSKMNDFILVL